MTAVLGCCLLLGFPAQPDFLVAVQPVAGPTVTGRLSGLTTEQLELTEAGAARTFDCRDVLMIRPLSAPEPLEAEATVWIELLGGTSIPARQYLATDKVATLYLLDGETCEFPITAVRSVRFRKPRAQLARQWDELATGEHPGDRVIIQRQEDSLDKLDGILHEVTEEKVQFEFNDTRIPVDRAKLAGIVYRHPPAALADAVCGITTSDQAVWRVRSLSLSGGKLDIATVAGVEYSIPLAAIRSIDFSSGNVSYLSDLDPVSIEWTPYLSSRIAADRLARLYEPRRDESLEGGKLSLGDGPKAVTYDKGLAIHSRTELVYRLTQEYRRFAAVAGIDTRVRAHGHVELVIFGDDRELYRRTITGRDESAADIDLDLRGVRRLRILVDFGQELDIADHLNLCNARILK